MLLRLDAARPEPIFEQLAAQIRGDVARGDLVSGERLPAAARLAASLDVNVHTVLRAYQLLRDEGVVELRPGRGAVVTGNAGALTALTPDVDALVQRAKALGLSPESLVSLVKEAARATI